jgi:outer membrane receptor protein involved in Fe transport
LGAGLPEKNLGVEVRQGLEEGGIVLQGRYRDFNEYSSPEGVVLDSQASDRGFLARFGHELGPGMLSAGWQSDHAGNTGRPTTRSDRISTSYPQEDSERFTVSYDFDANGGFSRLGLVGFLGTSRLVTERDTLATETSKGHVLSSDIEAKDYSLRGLAVRPLSNARFEFGIDLNGRFDLSASNTVELYSYSGDVEEGLEEVAIENARRNDSAAYASAEMLIGRIFTVSGGLRFDYVTTRNDGGTFDEQSTANSAFSGFGSLKVDLTRGVTLTGQVSSGFRDPSLSARYFVGASGRGFVTGNPELEPESSLQYDLAFRFVRGKIRWAVYGYYYRITDLIERYEEGDDLFFFRNRGEARIQGLEFELQGSAGRGVIYEIGAQLADGITVNDQAPLDDIPASNIQLQIRKELGTRNYVRVQLGIFAEDDDPGPTEIVTPSFVNLSVGGGWRISEPLLIRFAIRNVLDRSFPISPDRRAVLAPGISGVVTLIAEF